MPSILLGCFAASLLLASCQTDEGLGSPAQTDQKPTLVQQAKTRPQDTATAPAQSSFYSMAAGNGPISVGYLGIRRNDTAGRQADADYRNGALMAVNLRGNGIVTLNLMEASNGLEDVAKAVRSLQQKNIGVLLTSARGAELAAIRSALATQPIPVIAFVGNHETAGLGEEFYPFLSLPKDSLLEATSYAVAEGGRRPVILATSASDKTEAERLAAKIKAMGIAAPLVIDLTVGLRNPKAVKTWREADLAVIMPEVRNPASVIKALDTSSGATTHRRYVVSMAQTASELADPVLSGSNVCRYDHNIGERIGQKHLSTYGMPASEASAYGYDAMSTLIGIADRYGGAGFAKPYLTQESGFVGAMGLFRFNGDNTVQRNCDIFKVANGRFVFIQRAPATF
ncbi:hypothetical protein ACFSE1_07785 [Rhizobium helianthi]|uniref:ABC transporter substrate-binding protein n=1 Tax=Rhizobium helianthi TaxID=1132695 RepID=A0ABW4M251_9HYPH